MCTVSVIAQGDGVRLVCNRDELRSRPAALPPTIVSRSSARIVMPVDPESGGTWIAANDAGLIFTLLNVNRSELDTEGQSFNSRGELIPRLFERQTLDEVVREMSALDLRRFKPFRLVVVSQALALERVPETDTLRYHALTVPLMFTSSSLGDERVDGPRRALFRRLVLPGRNLPAKQDRFHAHRWPSRPHLSVRMEREDAMTVSRTTVESTSDRVDMTYVDTAGVSFQLGIPRRYRSRTRASGHATIS